jgi:methylglutaconyl-CoA hydratase
MESGSLSIHKLNRIATIQFFHPASNSLPSFLLEKLENSFNELSQDLSIRVIILKSEKEEVFCAGASFDELLAIQNIADGITFFSGFGKVVNAMRKCTKPIIGRIQGKTVGGGVGLIAACDYAMASEKAFIKLSEISIGIGPFVVEPAITRKIGVAAIGELAFNPTMWQNAYWAKEKGLYARVFKTINELDKEVQILAEQLNSYSPEALQNLKRILWDGTGNWDEVLSDRAKICGKLVLSDETKTALKKFKDKS